MKPLAIFCAMVVFLTACAPEIRLTKTAIRSQVNQQNQLLFFYDRNWKGTSYEKAKYYRIFSYNKSTFQQYSITAANGPITNYYMSGAVQARIEGALRIDEYDDRRSQFVGKVTHYTPGGQVSGIAYYIDGKPNGAWTTFDAAGNITSQIYYDKGKQVATPEQISSNNVTAPATKASLFRTAAPPPAYTGPCACTTCFGKRGMVCSECGGDGKKCGTEYRYVTEWVYKNVSKPVSVSEYDYSCKCYRSFTRYKYVYERVQERVNKLVSTCDIACTRCNQSGRLACITCSGSGKGKCD